MMLRVALNRKTPSYAHSKAVRNGLLPPFAHQVAFSKLSRQGVEGRDSHLHPSSHISSDSLVVNSL